MNSAEIEVHIRKLHKRKQAVCGREARERGRRIFGEVPRNYSDVEEMLGEVARIYVLRAYKRHDLKEKFLPAHEWIALWHENEPKATVKELLKVANGYITEWCGISG